MANGSEFIKNYMDAKNQRIQQQVEAEEKTARDKASIEKFNNTISTYLKGYSDWAKNNNGKFVDATPEDMDARVRKLVKSAGMSEGALNDKSTDVEIANYGTAFLNNLSGLKEDGSEYKFQDYLRDFGNDRAKEAAGRQARGEAAVKYLKELYKDNPNVRYDEYGVPERAFGGGGIRETQAREYINEARQNADEDAKWLGSSRTQFNTWRQTYTGDLYDLFENYDEESVKPASSSSATTEKRDDSGKKADNKSASETSEDTVTFTLPRANDPNYRGFGQKIVDLGLATSKGLWGADGDVQFYTKQLYDQGALDSRGNLKIGVPIKLKRRKVSK